MISEEMADHQDSPGGASRIDHLETVLPLECEGFFDKQIFTRREQLQPYRVVCGGWCGQHNGVNRGIVEHLLQPLVSLYCRILAGDGRPLRGVRFADGIEVADGVKIPDQILAPIATPHHGDPWRGDTRKRIQIGSQRSFIVACYDRTR